VQSFRFTQRGAENNKKARIYSGETHVARGIDAENNIGCHKYDTMMEKSITITSSRKCVLDLRSAKALAHFICLFLKIE
jgi:hypothetical protein